MTEPDEPQRTAWQPLTPRGVAAFARAPIGRLILVQFVFALLVAVVVVWFLRTAWFPTIREAIRHLPADGEIQSGKLDWYDPSPEPLAEGHFLAFVVDTNHTGTLSPAQVQVEFGRNDILFYSLAGYWDWPYPADWNFGLNRTEAEPWWGAWQAPLQWLAFAGTLLWCFVSWALLAIIYAVPVWLGGFFANRDLNLLRSWKLAGAAQMPGALVLTAGIVLYGFGVLDLVGLAAAVAVHILVSWTYLPLGVRAAPRLASRGSENKNPFVGNETVSNNN